MKKVLTIAGSDTCGGAGIQADLKTFSALGTYGMSVITAVTVQNTQGVFGCQDITPEIIAGQIDAIFTDIFSVDAVKVGMVSQIETINTIADKLELYKPQNVVIDPVMISKSGFDLLRPEAKDALISRLIPLATVLTPNLPEAEVITGMKIENIEQMEEAAKKTEGVQDATVSFMTQKMKVEFAEGAEQKKVMNDVLKACKKVEPDCEIFMD